MAVAFAGRFALVDPLAEGGSGVVWRAWDLRERQYVAAKVLRQVDAASLVRFAREQATRIRHPHVLTPTGWAGEDDRVLLAMPLVDGGSLATLAGDFAPLPAPWIARIADQALQALEAVHAAGVVHRDVTPANLLLDATGTGEPRLRLTDFGIAARIGDPRLTTGPFAVGTAGFRAPEAHDADPHPSADVYALGMTLDALGPGGVLRALVDEMLAEAPGERPSPGSLRERLHATGLLERPLGDDVEVFRQLPELPPAWGPRGPAPDASMPTESARPVPAVDDPPDRASSRRAGALLAGSLAMLAVGATSIVAALLLA